MDFSKVYEDKEILKEALQEYQDLRMLDRNNSPWVVPLLEDLCLAMQRIPLRSRIALYYHFVVGESQWKAGQRIGMGQSVFNAFVDSSLERLLVIMRSEGHARRNNG